jgi:hypothetical protein
MLPAARCTRKKARHEQVFFKQGRSFECFSIGTVYRAVDAYNIDIFLRRSDRVDFRSSLYNDSNFKIIDFIHQLNLQRFLFPAVLSSFL